MAVQKPIQDTLMKMPQLPLRSRRLGQNICATKARDILQVLQHLIQLISNLICPPHSHPVGNGHLIRRGVTRGSWFIFREAWVVLTSG